MAFDNVIAGMLFPDVGAKAVDLHGLMMSFHARARRLPLVMPLRAGRGETRRAARLGPLVRGARGRLPDVTPAGDRSSSFRVRAGTEHEPRERP